MRRPTLPALVGALAITVAAGAPAGAQFSFSTRPATWVGSPADDYVRLMQLTGAVPLSSRMLRPLESEANPVLPDTGPVWLNPWRARFAKLGRDTGDSVPNWHRVRVEAYAPMLRSVYNSRVPFGGDDGALWAGKGLSGAVDLGAEVKWGPVTARLAPTLWYARNEVFPLGPLYGQPPAGTSPYADPYSSKYIDQPQRFGEAPLEEADWGESSIAVEGRGARASFGTENMWWGPGIDNSILMSNNPGGFRHLAVGTQHPANIYIGKIELQYTLGWLQQSSYWRASIPDSATHRYLNAIAFTFEPRGAPGLYVGMARMFYAYVPRGGLSARELGVLFQPLEKEKIKTGVDSLGNDLRDQMLSLFMRWVMPQSDFEVYGEYARNDHAGNRQDLIVLPEHSRGYLVGLQKVFPQDAGFLRLRAEATNLVQPLTRIVRGGPTWYVHWKVAQGYTERGQVIGAEAGPGGDEQVVSVELYRKWGRVGLTANRRRLNSDFAFLKYEGQNVGSSPPNDTFFGFGPQATVHVGSFAIDAAVLGQTEYSRYTIFGNNIRNVHGEVTVEYELP